jgi:hypothetical protein
LGAGFRQIAIEVTVDNSYIRLALLALTPVQIFFTLFFAQVIVGCLAQLFGPVRQMTVNSKFYSARAPPRLQGTILPHVTIQCPVYKEGLSSVIAPTVKSIKQAISTYELQGGSANMFVNDDGLQIIDEDERRARIEFYADHSIGWVARPKHGDNFIRKGKFKKVRSISFITRYRDYFRRDRELHSPYISSLDDLGEGLKTLTSFLVSGLAPTYRTTEPPTTTDRLWS